MARITPAPSLPVTMSQKRIVDCDGTSSTGSGVSSTKSQKSRIFPSTRFFMAILLCCCFISLSVSTSNISVSMVCMVRKHGLDNQSNYEIAQDIMRIKRSLANDSKANELFLGGLYFFCTKTSGQRRELNLTHLVYMANAFATTP